MLLGAFYVPLGCSRRNPGSISNFTCVFSPSTSVSKAPSSFYRTPATGLQTHLNPILPHHYLVISANKNRWSPTYNDSGTAMGMTAIIQGQPVCIQGQPACVQAAVHPLPGLQYLVSTLRCWPVSHSRCRDRKEKQCPHQCTVLQAVIVHRLGTIQCLPSLVPRQASALLLSYIPALFLETWRWSH